MAGSVARWALRGSLGIAVATVGLGQITDTPSHDATTESSPDTLPTTRPRIDVRATARPMPSEFRILMRRSIFSKEPIAPFDEISTPESGGEAVDFVLRGITNDDGIFLAFVEDARTGQIQTLHTGDSLGHGRVAEISFGGVTYRSDSVTVIVCIGCTFDGHEWLRPGATQPADLGPLRDSGALRGPAADERIRTSTIR